MRSPNKDQDYVDNRADQLNPNNEKYYQSRGIEKPVNNSNYSYDEDEDEDEYGYDVGDDVDGGWYPGYDW